MRRRKLPLGSAFNVAAFAEPTLYALLVPPDATAAYQRLCRLARGLGAEDPRGMDTRRADLPDPADPSGAGRGRHCCSATRGTGDGPGRPLVSVIVPITMLLGLDEQPGELVGHGPIPTALAREIAAEGTWWRLLTDPASGTLLDYGRTTYTPPAASPGPPPPDTPTPATLTTTDPIPTHSPSDHVSPGRSGELHRR